MVGELRAEPAAAQFGDERSEILLRMTQKAQRNIDRHAKATRVAVILELVPDTHVVLRIEDDGVGFDPQTTRVDHYGLIGLREQADLMADLRIDSKLDVGTKICVSLPISPIVFISPILRGPEVDKK